MLTEVSKIIEHALNGDKARVNAYAELLADNLKKEGNERGYRMIMGKLDRDNPVNKPGLVGLDDSQTIKDMNENLNFGQALEALKSGKKVTRSIWGGYWIYSKSGVLFDGNVKPTPESEGLSISFSGGIIIAVLANGAGYAVAQAYQPDMLAEDWKIVD